MVYPSHAGIDLVKHWKSLQWPLVRARKTEEERLLFHDTRRCTARVARKEFEQVKHCLNFGCFRLQRDECAQQAFKQVVVVWTHFVLDTSHRFLNLQSEQLINPLD